MTGAFMLICSALVPMIRARSYFVIEGLVVRFCFLRPSAVIPPAAGNGRRERAWRGAERGGAEWWRGWNVLLRAAPRLVRG